MDPLSCPVWFKGFSIIFNIIFLLVTTGIAIIGYKGYSFSKRKNLQLHSIGFGLLAFSYLVLTITNIVVFARMGNIVSWMVGGLYLYTALFLTGMVVLLFVYLKIKELKIRALILILILAIVLVFNKPTSMSQGMVFFLLAAALIGFIVAHLARHYQQQGRQGTLCVLIGFSLLLIGQILFALEFLGMGFYVAAAFVMLGAYGSIAASRLMSR